ncbi:MAG: ATPase domain-containing protein [Methanogenium sp.]|jgi:recombination protein RecA
MSKKKKDNGEVQEGTTLKHDKLVDVLAESINESYQDSPEPTAYVLGSVFETPADVTDFVSTGNDLLDLKISNRPNGGVPVGRVTEIMGWEASGKSLLCAHLLANTQKKGGVAVFIDTEAAISREFLEAIGVNLQTLVYVSHDLIEDCFTSIEKVVETIRKSNNDRLVTIVCDSVSAASTKIEQESDYDKDGWSTSKAIIISKAMRKLTGMIAKKKICLVFTNQLREKLGVMFGDKSTTSGGKALGFHSSVRLIAKAVGQLKKGDDVVGIKTQVKVKKNRIGPPLRVAAFDIYFSSGIDNYGSWIDELKDLKVSDGKSFKYGEEEIKFKTKEGFAKLLKERSEVKDYLYKIICDANIMKYSNHVPEEGEVTLDKDNVEELNS